MNRLISIFLLLFMVFAGTACPPSSTDTSPDGGSGGTSGEDSGSDTGSGTGGGSGGADIDYDCDTAPTAPVAIVNDCTLPGVRDYESLMTQTIPYATIGGEVLRLDMVRPNSGGPYPLIIAIHGGSWNSGIRDFLSLYEFADQGYVATSLDYRLISGTSNTFPTAVSDVRCASRFLRAHATDYNIDPNRVVVLGHSAGGHLALMLADASNVSSLDLGDCPNTGDLLSISGVVSLAGPSDMRPGSTFATEQVNEITQLLGVEDINAASAQASLASPYVHVDPSDPPHLLTHSTNDSAVPIEDTRRLHTRLGEACVGSTLHELSGLPDDTAHELSEHLLDENPLYRPMTCTVMAFLDAILSP